ncbi:MAG: hypothetical protein ABIF45_19645 [Pseudomonadota bacterium]
MDPRSSLVDFQAPLSALPVAFSASPAIDFAADAALDVYAIPGASCASTAILIIPTAKAAAIATFIM